MSVFPFLPLSINFLYAGIENVQSHPDDRQQICTGFFYHDHMFASEFGIVSMKGKFGHFEDCVPQGTSNNLIVQGSIRPVNRFRANFYYFTRFSALFRPETSPKSLANDKIVVLLIRKVPVFFGFLFAILLNFCILFA